MTAEERQHRIEAYLMKVEFASLEELAQHTGASVSSVRRDVTALEAKGNIRRTHGGARLTAPRSDEFAFSSRDTQQLSEKERIARACSDLIAANQTVIIDAGTTCYHVARHLENKPLHIVTNSLPVAQHYGSSQRIEVVVSGGVIYPRLGVLVGPLAVEAFSRVRAEIAVMSCGGLTADGVMNSHGLLIDIQRAMMRAARRVILCVDHTKFGRQSISRLCELDAIDTLVCDEAPPAEILSALSPSTRVIVAGVSGTALLQTGIPPEATETGNPIANERPATTPAADTEQKAVEHEVFADRDQFID